MYAPLFLVMLFCAVARADLEEFATHHSHHSFDQVMRNYHHLQGVLDAAVERKHQVGTMSWLSNMCLYFWKVAHRTNIHSICEVGFGNGFSSTLFLTAGNATMVSFDLFPQKVESNSEMGDLMVYMPKSQTAGRAFINSKFPGRFTAVEGYSTTTVPEFVRSHPGYKCDLIFIDGSHTTEGVMADIRNFKALAHKDTVVLMDDLEYAEPIAAVNIAVREGIITASEYIQGEAMVDPDFGIPGWTRLNPPKMFFRGYYNL